VIDPSPLPLALKGVLIVGPVGDFAGDSPDRETKSAMMRDVRFWEVVSTDRRNTLS
jgi:hypothetical protein